VDTGASGASFGAKFNAMNRGGSKNQSNGSKKAQTSQASSATSTSSGELAINDVGSPANIAQDTSSSVSNTGTNVNQSLLSSAEDGFSSVLNSATETIKSSDLYKDNEMLINFIADEGVDVLLRTGQTVGGAGQVLLGGAICYGSGGLACAAGAVIAAKGGDNIYSGLSGSQSVSENLLQRATGSKTTGTLINAGLDIGTSAIGLMRAAPKINELGQPMRHLMRKDPTLTEASFRQATTTALTVEAATATATVADTLMKLKQN
jgi:hypothetical protein